MNDVIQRFIFENQPIRGEMVRLGATWQAVLERHDYPPVVHNVLGQLMAAAALLAATIKFSGTLIMQIQGTGAVRLMVVECTSEHQMRATAKCRSDEPIADARSLRELVGDGKFAIIIDPGEGKQTYQGIVALEGESVAELLENYMLRSEQLATRLWLTAHGSTAAGMLLQKLPEHSELPDAWQHATVLADSLSEQELATLGARDILRRLYSMDDVRIFRPKAVCFRCSCSRRRVSGMLRMIGLDEVRSIVAERGEVEVHCEFCGRRYRFDSVEAEQIFAAAHAGPPGPTRH
jgi:molecular chaperone Hsp33